MKKTITFPCLKRCWLPVVIALFYALNLSAQDTCNLVCNDHVNASMPADGCIRSFEPDDFLENPGLTCQTYQVQLSYPYGTHKLNGNDVDRSHIGYTFIYRVVETTSQNSCWGYVTIEDKAAPQPVCKNARVSCFQISRLSQIVGVIIDNCGQTGSSAIENLQWSDYGCNDPRGLGQVIRRIRTWDTWGNSATCSDTLIIGRDSLINVTCPDPITLGCRVLCKKPGNTGSNSNVSNFDLIQFSSDKTSPNYPSPDKLLQLQLRDTFGSLSKCIPANLKVVPFIDDSVLVMQGDICILVDSTVAMYPALGGFCKISLTWTDQIIPICGSGFKIRREWLLVDWCTQTDTTCVQYIKIDDKEAPIVKQGSTLSYNVNTGPHNCIAMVDVKALLIDDCDPNVKQNYTVEYTLDSHPGKINVINGVLPAKVSLPALTSNFNGQVHHEIHVFLADGCFNRTDTVIHVRVRDVTPPNPVCDEITQTTVDPTTCWARVYAHDLDNGSKDNCCNVLHFAVAHMDTIEKVRAAYAAKLIQDCGSTHYWKYKKLYDYVIDQYINCYVFKDYIDLGTCGSNQVVLRVYEACGIPRYDPHVFPCSEHDWYCYNAYTTYRIWRNYQWLHPQGGKDCEAKPAWLCTEAYFTWLISVANTIGNGNGSQGFAQLLLPVWEGASTLAADILSVLTFGIVDVSICTPFYFPEQLANAKLKLFPQGTSDGGFAPGNTCSALLYNECMVNVLVDDKTPPVCEKPNDLYWYCDNVTDVREIRGKRYFFSGHKYNKLEYASAVCGESFTNDLILANGNGNYDYDPTVNASDGSCIYNDVPYNAIECEIEFDNNLSDTADATGKAFGWYGCNIYGPAHQDEHANYKDVCESNRDSWSPVYCHTWLCLDRRDSIGKTDPKTAFYKPVLRSGGRGADVEPGQFIIWDNCALGDVTSKDESYIDNCGNGWVKRTWTIKDKCNTTVTCDQKIITKHRSDFEVEFPQDVTVSCILSGTLTPDITGRPMVMDDDCELVGVNYDDVRYDIVPDACYKIVRTWKLIDWCKYDPNAHERDPEVIVDDRKVAHTTERYCVYRHLKDEGDGYMTYTQIIKVTDSEAPIVSCRDTTICLYTGTDANCTAPDLSIPFSATDNCTDVAKITYRWELDLNASASNLASKVYNKASIDAKSPTYTNSFTSNTIKDGTHLVHVIAKDNCGNEDTCTFVLSVKDCKKPTPYCFNGIATVIMPTSGEITVWASDLNAGSFDNCTPKANLTYSFGTDKNVTSKVFTCSDLPNGISATIEVDIYVWDAAGNNDFCRTYLLIQDGNGNKCPDNAGAVGSIAGKINTENQDAVEKVKLDIKSTISMPAYHSDVKGNYSFASLPFKENYTIVPSRDDDAMNGVSTIDLVLIEKHILGVTPFNSPYKLIAADVDRNKDITVVDLVELRRLILSVYDKLPNNTSWRFVPKSYAFASTGSPLTANFPEQIDINKLSQNELNRDFVGIKIGDVNMTATPHSLLGAEARESSSSLRFKTEEKELKAGETATVEFKVDNFTSIEGYQFSLALSGLTLLDIKKGDLKVEANNFGLTKLNQGYITTSWSDVKSSGRGTSLKPGAVAFSLKVKADRAVKLSESIRINSRYTRAEAYASDGANSKFMGVSLEIGNSAQTANYVLFQNTPNPFKNETVIGFELGRDEKTNITITDVTGKLIKSYQMDGVRGVNKLTVNRNEFGGVGVLYYTIKTKTFSDTKKMLLVE